MLPVAILAGGGATRLRPVTEKIPKALIEINGEPFLAHQLRLLASKGVKRATLCVGYLGEMLEAYAGDGSRFAPRRNATLFSAPKYASLKVTGNSMVKSSPRCFLGLILALGSPPAPNMREKISSVP